MTAKEFCTAFIDKMKEGNVDAEGKKYFEIYKDSKALTKLMRIIVPEIIENYDTTTLCSDRKKSKRVKAEFEYFRIDCIGYEQRISEIKDDAEDVGLKAHLWDLKVAVEYENKPLDWTDEVIKLCHIRCPLKVVIGYCPCDEREEDESKLSVVADWIQDLGVNDDNCKDELLIILGNSKGDNVKKYNNFDYRGYLYDYKNAKFNML